MYQEKKLQKHSLLFLKFPKWSVCFYILRDTPGEPPNKRVYYEVSLIVYGRIFNLWLYTSFNIRRICSLNRNQTKAMGGALT
jgi:hypothetical protein